MSVMFIHCWKDLLVFLFREKYGGWGGATYLFATYSCSYGYLRNIGHQKTEFLQGCLKRTVWVQFFVLLVFFWLLRPVEDAEFWFHIF